MWRFASAVLVVVLGVSGLAAAGDKPLLTLIRGWGKVVDPDGDCRVAVAGAKVTITVPGSAHDFAAELHRWNSPRIVREVKADFVAEVKVSGSFDPKPKSTIEGRKAYNGAGILLIADNDNHASLQRASFWDGDHVRHYLNFEVRRGGELAGERFGMDIPDADCWLRLERRGAKLYAMTSSDGVNWKSYEPLDVELPETLKVGVELVNSAEHVFECGFERFTLFQCDPPEENDEQQP